MFYERLLSHSTIQQIELLGLLSSKDSIVLDKADFVIFGRKFWVVPICRLNHCEDLYLRHKQLLSLIIFGQKFRIVLWCVDINKNSWLMTEQDDISKGSHTITWHTV